MPFLFNSMKPYDLTTLFFLKGACRSKISGILSISRLALNRNSFCHALPSKNTKVANVLGQ